MLSSALKLILYWALSSFITVQLLKKDLMLPIYFKCPNRLSAIVKDCRPNPGILTEYIMLNLMFDLLPAIPYVSAQFQPSPSVFLQQRIKDQSVETRWVVTW